MLSGKFALGTVQFGLEYGISNTKGVATDNELQKIIAHCSAHKIDTFDTASAYGNAEKRLGAFLPKDALVIGKFIGTNNKQIRAELSTSLNHLKTTRLHGYLAHRVNDIIQQPTIWDSIEELKNENQIINTGISIYNPSEFKQIIELGIQPDIVQLPFNLLDHRMLETISYCAKHEIEVHVRSVFLQGLFFLNPSYLPKHLELFREPLLKILALAKENNTSLLQLALQFVLNNTFVSKVIIGVQSVKQLDEIIDASSTSFINKNLSDQILDIHMADNSMLLPQNWK
jgi:aryl-alcohol dehydrogenase-like predicted oxidoreductase